jgi:hypothetical protein
MQIPLSCDLAAEAPSAASTSLLCASAASSTVVGSRVMGQSSEWEANALSSGKLTSPRAHLQAADEDRQGSQHCSQTESMRTRTAIDMADAIAVVPLKRDGAQSNRHRFRCSSWNRRGKQQVRRVGDVHEDERRDFPAALTTVGGASRSACDWTARSDTRQGSLQSRW